MVILWLCYGYPMVRVRRMECEVGSCFLNWLTVILYLLSR